MRWPDIREWLGHFFGGLYKRAEQHHIFLMAGGLSFSLITCILPLVLIVFAVLGRVLNTPSIAAEIRLFIERAIPYQDIAVKAEEIVFSRVDEFIIYKNLAGLLGIAGLLFAASGLFSSMRTTLNTIYRVSSAGFVLLDKLRDLGLVVLVIIYFLLSTTILPGLDVSQELAQHLNILGNFGINLSEFALGLFSLVIIFISFFIVYFFIPNRRPRRRIILVSATTAAILWHVAQQLFEFYLTHFVTLKRIYGAYFFLIVVGFWIYYTSLVFILGAETGQLAGEWADRRRDRAAD